MAGSSLGKIERDADMNKSKKCECCEVDSPDQDEKIEITFMDRNECKESILNLDGLETQN